MTDLTIPPDATDDHAAALVRDHVHVGDDVTVRSADRTGSGDPGVTGEVTAIEPGYLELEGEGPSGKGVRYDEMQTVTRVQAEDNPDAGPS